MLRQQLVGLSLIPPSIFGFISNWTIVIIVIRYRNLHRSFAILTATIAFFYALGSTFDLFFVSPMIILNINFLKEYSGICGVFSILSYDSTTQFHVVVSINRLIAVFAPLSYNTFFNPRTTKFLIGFIIFLSAIVVSTYLLAVDCRFSFIDDRWTFLITGSDKCEFFGWSMFLGKNLFLSVVNLILHIITFARVLSLKKLPRRSNTSRTYSLQESYFLKQTFGQTIFMSIEIIAYIFPARNIEQDYITFLCSIFLWSTVHAAEGVITLIYNSEIRRKLRKRKKSYRISATKVELPH
ncbi:CRE-SRX-34 protein [Caenorhabditis remanei]|uniref:CRE-SRX-34 protein n=1 Tax=Caenorhabditis remanei TaxID=31234 RepID=E3LPL3_CAERE|nr:CRE-SRX-34 protein [Caenorhabditis remanei]